MTTPADVEAALRRDWDEGAFDRVATRALETYGPEILGVLSAQLRSTSDASEAFSMFAEDLWRGLPGFQWRCTFRAWAHRLARNAGIRWVSAGAHQRERNVPLSDISAISHVVEKVRVSTAMFLRTEVKSAIRSLRDELPVEEQLLLVLRVDKDMEWREIAAAMSDRDLGEEELTREAARLRKRYRLAAGRLRKMAKERGLIVGGEE